jgi:hypothetical protein
MCVGIQVVYNCNLCRTHTPVGEIQWQGCHLENLGRDSLPVCSAPTITQDLKDIDCQMCLTEADDGHDPDDVYPEPPEHPGFPLPKTEITLSRYQLSRPTNNETPPRIENLAGSADELPSYEDAMKDSPVNYALSELRYDANYRRILMYDVHEDAVYHYEKLASVADKRRQLILDLQTRIPSDIASTTNLLHVALKTIESIMSEQQQTIYRIRWLQGHLNFVKKDINFLGSHYPSPSEMALLKDQHRAIVRELEEKHIQNSMGPTAEDWDSRLGTLLDNVMDEWRKSIEADFAEMSLWAEETPREPRSTSSCCLQ